MFNEFFDLPCYDGHKSFYGKAKVISDGTTNHLISYKTSVCELKVINYKTAEVTKLWDNYSVTTMRHINSFLNHFGFPKISKKEWESLPLFDGVIITKDGIA